MKEFFIIFVFGSVSFYLLFPTFPEKRKEKKRKEKKRKLVQKLEGSNFGNMGEDVPSRILGGILT